MADHVAVALAWPTQIVEPVDYAVRQRDQIAAFPVWAAIGVPVAAMAAKAGDMTGRIGGLTLLATRYETVARSVRIDSRVVSLAKA